MEDDKGYFFGAGLGGLNIDAQRAAMQGIRSTATYEQAIESKLLELRAQILKLEKQLKKTLEEDTDIHGALLLIRGLL